MEIITRFLEAMEAIKLGLVTGMVAAGLVVLAVALHRRNAPVAIIGLIIGSFPFALPAVINGLNEASVAQRRAVVREMPRVSISGRHPRQLEIRGEIPKQEVARLMILGYFDEVLVDDGYGRTWFSSADTSEACRDALAIDELRFLGYWPGLARPTKAEAKAAFQKVDACAPTSRQSFPLKPTRLLLRLDRDVTLNERNRWGAPEAFQLSLVRGDREALLHYDEMPLLDPVRSASRLLGEGVVYPCDGFDDVQLIANLLDASGNTADNRELILQRPGRLGDCLKAAEPVPSSEESAARKKLLEEQRVQILEHSPWYLARASARRR